MAGAKSSPVPAIERALTLLEFLAQSKSGFSTSEISRRLGLPKSSTYLIVDTLERREFLQKNRQNGRYYLGMKLITLTRYAIENLDLREEAKPYLRSLMKETKLIVHMAVLDGTEAMLIDKVEALGTGRQTSFVGRRLHVPQHRCRQSLGGVCQRRRTRLDRKTQGLSAAQREHDYVTRRIKAGTRPSKIPRIFPG